MEFTLEYIDNYFNDNLSAEEKDQFEKRCIEDPLFAEEIAFYIMANEAIKEEWMNEKRKHFIELYNKNAQNGFHPIPVYKKLWPYIAAAACIFFVFVLSIFLRNPSPRQLATKFVQEELNTIPVTMGNNEDSLGLAITAYNNHDYKTAEILFYNLYEKDSSNAEIVEYLGITYLVSQRYGKAISKFDQLTSFTNLKMNPGKFYKAVSLMMQSNDNDTEEAKKLFQEIVNNHLPGSKKAAEWLKDL
jgi:tetratricopeptide (TPR) repeat protein